MTDVVLLSAFLFISLLVMHAICLRFWGSTQYVLRSLAVFFVFACVCLAFLSGSFEFRVITVTTLGLLWAMKMVVIVNLLNSVSLRMVRTLMNEKSGMLPRAVFFERFSEDGNLGIRLEMMEKSRLVERKPDGALLLTSSGKRLALAFSAIQRLFRIYWIG